MKLKNWGGPSSVGGILVYHLGGGWRWLQVFVRTSKIGGRNIGWSVICEWNFEWKKEEESRMLNEGD